MQLIIIELLIAVMQNLCIVHHQESLNNRGVTYNNLASH